MLDYKKKSFFYHRAEWSLHFYWITKRGLLASNYVSSRLLRHSLGAPMWNHAECFLAHQQWLSLRKMFKENWKYIFAMQWQPVKMFFFDSGGRLSNFEKRRFVVAITHKKGPWRLGQAKGVSLPDKKLFYNKFPSPWKLFFFYRNHFNAAEPSLFWLDKWSEKRG